MTGELASLVVRIGASVTGLSQGIAQAKGDISSFASHGKTQMNDWLKANQAMVQTVSRNFVIMGTAITAFTAVAVKGFADTEKAMALLSTELEGVAKTSMPMLEEGIRSLAETTGQSADKMASSMRHIFEVTSDPAKALTILAETNKLAMSSNTDLQVAVEGVLSVMSAYKIKAEDVTKVTDWFTTVASRGRGTVTEYAEAISKLAPYAAQAGAKTDELGAMLSTLTKNGVDVNVAMTAVRSTLTSFQKPSKDATDLARALGFEMSQTALQENGLMWAMQQVDKAAEDQVQVLLGNRQAKLATQIATRNLAQYEQELAVQQSNAGATQEKFVKTQATFGVELSKLQASWKNLLDAGIAPVMPELTKMVEKITLTMQTMRQWAKENPELTKSISSFVVGMGPLLILLGGVLPMVMNLAIAMTSVQKAMVVAKEAQMTFAFAQTATVTALNPVLVIIGAIVIALGVIAKAWWDAKMAEQQASEAMKGVAEQTLDRVTKSNQALSDMALKYSDLTVKEKYHIESLQQEADSLLKTAQAQKENGTTLEEAQKLSADLIAFEKERKTLIDDITASHVANTEAVVGNTEAKKDASQTGLQFTEEIKVESKEVLELEAQYRALNQQLADGTIKKDEYAKSFNKIVESFRALKMPMEEVLKKLNEIDKLDPNIEVKLRVFGMEDITDISERIKAINQEIVLSQLDGDAKRVQSAKFTAEEEINTIKQKMEWSARYHQQKINELTAYEERERERIMKSLQYDKAEKDALLATLQAYITKQKAILDEEQKAKLAQYEQELKLATQLADIKIAEAQRAVSASSTMASGAYTASKSVSTTYSGFKAPVFGEVDAWTAQNFPVLTSGGYFPNSGGLSSGASSVASSPSGYDYSPLVSKAVGSTFIPKTGPYLLHRGEEVIPRETSERVGNNVTIANFISEDLLMAFLANNPSAVVNIVGSDIVRRGNLSKIIKGV